MRANAWCLRHRSFTASPNCAPVSTHSRNLGIFRADCLGGTMRSKPCLTSADVKKMMAACVAEAEKNNWKVTIAIVDDGAALLSLERMDGAPAISATVAPGKSKTSALTKQPTKFWEDRVKQRPAFANFPAGLLIKGAVPIVHQGECIGAIGVSGLQSSQDAQIAQAGVAALG